MKTALFIAIILLIAASSGGCSSVRDLTSDDIRAGINECTENNLDVLAYKRMDGSILGIRCVPKDDEIQEIHKLRNKTPVKLMRFFW